MAATDCNFYEQGLCMGKIHCGKNFKCKGMKNPESNIIECIAENSDLVDGCERCELVEANATFPYNEYCKACAKEIKKEEDGDNNDS